MLQVETVDAPAWWAVLIIDYEDGKPRIRCIGFAKRHHRDRWLRYFVAAAGNLADSLPTH